MTDFVMPRQGWNAQFQVHEQGFVDQEHHFVENNDTIEFEAGPPQEVTMWRNFARFSREIDAGVKLERTKRDDETKRGGSGPPETMGWGNSPVVKVAERKANLTLETQRIVSALMESIRSNGEKIYMKGILSADGEG